MAGRSPQRTAMASEPPITDMQQLMASVGSVMLHWCFLEDALTDTIRQLRIASEGSANLIRVRGSFSDRLSEWRGLLSQKTRRNPELAETVADLANEMEHLRGLRTGSPTTLPARTRRGMTAPSLISGARNANHPARGSSPTASPWPIFAI